LGPYPAEDGGGLGTNDGTRKTRVTTVKGLEDTLPVVQEGFRGIATTVEVICEFGHEAFFSEVTENATHSLRAVSDPGIPIADLV